MLRILAVSVNKTLRSSIVFAPSKPHICSVVRYSDAAISNEKDIPAFDLENPYKKERKECILCKLNISPDYKNAKLLSQFQSPYTGRIYGRHITGLCRKKQMLVEKEIVKAQNCGYMPYYNKDKSFLKDPKLFNPENPMRPHRF